MEHKSFKNHNKAHSVKKKSTVVFISLIVAASFISFFYWMFFRGTESTEDARISGHIVSLASRIDGQVTQVLVDNDTLVKKDQPLLYLDNAMLLANLQLAQSDFDAAIANFKQATVDVKQARANFLSAQSAKALEIKNLNRVLSLQQQKAISQQAVDQQKSRTDQSVATYESAQAVLYMSENVYKIFGKNISAKDSNKFLEYSEKMKGLNPTLDAAIAKLKRAKASLDIANLNLSYTVVKAPFDGIIANKTVEVGKNINSNVPLFSLISLNDTWISANFKETQIKHIHEGEPVKIKIDSYGSHEFVGIVASVSGASGDSFALLPPDNASGNFIKVTQRIPVKIKFQAVPGFIMRPGMSAEVTVKVK